MGRSFHGCAHPTHSGSSDLRIGHRLGIADATVYDAAKEIGSRVATVEAVAELIEVGLKMLGAYAVEDIQNPALEVADDHVHPGQKRGRVPGAFLDSGFMDIADGAQPAVRGPAIASITICVPASGVRESAAGMTTDAIEAVSQSCR